MKNIQQTFFNGMIGYILYIITNNKTLENLYTVILNKVNQTACDFSKKESPAGVCLGIIRHYFIFQKRFSVENLHFRFVSYTFRKSVLNYRTNSFWLRILVNDNSKK